jgi:hypothetical protein
MTPGTADAADPSCTSGVVSWVAMSRWNASSGGASGLSGSSSPPKPISSGMRMKPLPAARERRDGVVGAVDEQQPLAGAHQGPHGGVGLGGPLGVGGPQPVDGGGGRVQVDLLRVAALPGDQPPVALGGVRGGSGVAAVLRGQLRLMECTAQVSTSVLGVVPADQVALPRPLEGLHDGGEDRGAAAGRGSAGQPSRASRARATTSGGRASGSRTVVPLGPGSQP